MTFPSYLKGPWLPEPKLYRLQVKAEIRFRTRRFTGKTVEALEIVGSVSPLLLATPRTLQDTLRSFVSTIGPVSYDQLLMQMLHCEPDNFGQSSIYKVVSRE